mgnify:CR=1 FL=1
MKKVAIIGHTNYGFTCIGPLLNLSSRVSVNIIDDSDNNITVVGDLLKANTYDLTPQLPITRAQRRRNERNKKKKL